MNDQSLIAINVGNTRTQIGRFEDGELAASEVLTNESLGEIVELVAGWWASLSKRPRAAVVVASVNGPMSDRLVPALQDQLSVEVYRVGEDLPVPIGLRLDPETITGVDRLLNAAAAFEVVRQACVVVDAGTAVTIDFVDGDGTFHGGAIAPGGRMQLAALARDADALPEVEFARPAEDAFGRSTAQAMLGGVYHGIRGMVRQLVELYAERYGAYPLVVATGGDAPLLFEGDEFIDRIVPRLTLMGIAAAAKHAMVADDADLSR